MTDYSNIKPFGLHPVNKVVAEELIRRPTVHGNDGVRSAWLRVCSNGQPNAGAIMKAFSDIDNTKAKRAKLKQKQSEADFLYGKIPGADSTLDDMSFNAAIGGKLYDANHAKINSLEGFVMYGQPAVDGGFNSDYGIDGTLTLGVDVNNKPHTIKSTTFHNRPKPGIVDMTTEFYGAGSSFPGLCRRVVIKWRCWSAEQLEYLRPYFLSLSVTVIAEWGWDNYNPASLIDLTDTTENGAILKLYRDTSEIMRRIELSNGNYDCHMGRIIDYTFDANSYGGYDCSTTVVNPMYMHDGNTTNNQSATSINGEDSSFPTFLKDMLPNIGSEDLLVEFGNGEFNRTDAVALRKMYQMMAYESKDNYSIPAITNTQGKLPSPWISMRLVEAILDAYSTLWLTSVRQFVPNFSSQVIGAHPLLKSTDPHVIIPNANAPRLRPVGDTTDNGGTGAAKATYESVGGWTTGEVVLKHESLGFSGHLSNISAIVNTTVVATDYTETAGKLAKSLTETYSLSDSTDNLQALLGASGSFPQFVNGSVSENKTKAGYWGYLGDIYISKELFETEAKRSDTFLGLLENVLSRISAACSGIWEFRVIPNGLSCTTYTVIDDNYNPYGFANDPATKGLPNFVIGANNGTPGNAFSMAVKMQQEMAFQTLLGSEQSSADAKRVDKFVSGDRLFGLPGTYDIVKPAQEPPAPSEKKKKSPADIRAADKTSYWVKTRSPVKKYYIIEYDAELMKKLTRLSTAMPEGAALNSQMMPGTECQIEMPGIGGFLFLDLFTLSGVPQPYDRDHAVFQIDGLKSEVGGNYWKTSIVAKVRPLVIAT